jgi:cyclophilin family peptidyl-prolyl cis-trans isomerase
MSNVTKRGWSVQRRVRGVLSVLLLGMVSPLLAQGGKRPLVEVRTELGNMVFALYNETPIHRDHFAGLVRDGAYDGLLFHRVIPGFMVLGGDPEASSTPAGQEVSAMDLGSTLPAEIVPGIIHKRGALGAAREGEQTNPQRRSHGMQFYVVDGRSVGADELDRIAARAARYGDTLRYTAEHKAAYARDGGTPQLDGAYTVFGELVAGFEVLDAILAVKRDGSDRPLQELRMTMHLVP